jgi:hypothetical protein
VNLDDEEDRLAFQTWVSDMRLEMRALRERYSNRAPITLPKKFDEALAWLKQISESTAHDVDLAIWQFSRTKQWPENLSKEQVFFIKLRVDAACRTIEGVLSGEVTNPGVVEPITSDNPNFTEWILTDAWDDWGEAWLEHFADAYFKIF